MMDKIKNIKVEFNPIKRKNIWEIEYADGSREERELPTFIIRCLNCGGWINKHNVSECPLGSKECCNVCGIKCKELGKCQLK